MRHVILPASAMILCRGKFVVSELEPGDKVQGYDFRNRRLAMGTISVANPVEPVQKVLVPISQFKVIPIANETVGLAPPGIEQTILSTRQFLGFCQKTMKLVIRELECPVKSEGTVEAIELQWEWPDYLWFEGILVGTEL